MNVIAVPNGTRYVIETLEEPLRSAFFGSLEDVVRCMTEQGIAFDCQVIRIADGAVVWPIQTKEIGIT